VLGLTWKESHLILGKVPMRLLKSMGLMFRVQRESMLFGMGTVGEVVVYL